MIFHLIKKHLGCLWGKPTPLFFATVLPCTAHLPHCTLPYHIAWLLDQCTLICHINLSNTNCPCSTAWLLEQTFFTRVSMAEIQPETSAMPREHHWQKETWQNWNSNTVARLSLSDKKGFFRSVGGMTSYCILPKENLMLIELTGKTWRSVKFCVPTTNTQLLTHKANTSIA